MFDFKLKQQKKTVFKDSLFFIIEIQKIIF